MSLNRAIAVAALAALATLACSGLGTLIGICEESELLELHEATAIAFVGLVGIHLALHRRQILAIVRQCSARTRRVMGEYTLLLGLTIASVATAAMSPCDDEGGDECGVLERATESIAGDVHAVAGILLVGFAAYHLFKRRRLLFGARSLSFSR